jgi:hypothetical protein
MSATHGFVVTRRARYVSCGMAANAGAGAVTRGGAALATALVLPCAACHSVFDLDALYVPTAAGQIINDPEGDFEGDSEPNASDPLRLVEATLL